MENGCAQIHTWRKVTEKGPSGRERHAMVFDEAREVVVLYGGYTSGLGHSTETWEWNGYSWKLVATTGPEGRSDHKMIYDIPNRVVVLYGGSGNNYEIYDSIWTWNGNKWKKIKILSASQPEERIWHEMAYDIEKWETVMHGGLIIRSGQRSNVGKYTWTLKDSYWKRVSFDDNMGVYNFGMVYHRKMGRVIIFGGRFIWGSTSRPHYDDAIFSWDGKTWKKLILNGPSGRHGHSMVYDSIRGVAVIWGGSTVSESEDIHRHNDTWVFDGNCWTKESDAIPVTRVGQAMTYDKERQEVVLFGGRVPSVEGDYFPRTTWVYGTRSIFDLKIKKVKVKPTSAELGDDLKLICSIVNRGPYRSDRTTVELYISTDKSLDESDLLVGRHKLKSLAVKRKTKFIYNYQIAKSLEPGKYYFIALVKTKDLNSINNLKSSGKSVNVF
jgi:hypothetical protein